MAPDGGAPLPGNTSEQLTPELAPFVAHARAQLEQATRSLDPEAAVEHLEATVAQAEVMASRLGFSLPVPDLVDELGLDDGSVVVVQRVSGPGQPA